MIRQLQPWHENISKRQVKAPKIYFRDSGLLHCLLSVSDKHSLLGHPRTGASWEGFALEQFLKIVKPPEAYFWSTHSGAEIDLFFQYRGRRYGIEFKFSEAPKISRSMRIALNDLQLDYLWIIYPGQHSFPADDKITVCPLTEVTELANQLFKKQIIFWSIISICWFGCILNRLAVSKNQIWVGKSKYYLSSQFQNSPFWPIADVL
ncbi:MAG: DUF4143 domain-containing protein [Proteobacteria bacterium]|nr:DUF4143 domain-containing protein [Pseudomonadota bacterium]